VPHMITEAVAKRRPTVRIGSRRALIDPMTGRVADTYLPRRAMLVDLSHNTCSICVNVATYSKCLTAVFKEEWGVYRVSPS
jgi:hypothetical protein